MTTPVPPPSTVGIDAGLPACDDGDDARSVKGSLAYQVLVLAFPVSVLFCPRLPLLVTHARLDEVLVIAWLPLGMKEFLRVMRGEVARASSAYVKGFLALLALFTVGLLHGDGGNEWSQENLKLVLRPFAAIANVAVLRYWLVRARLQGTGVLAAVIVASALAGLLGWAAMFDPGLASSLTRLYSSGIEEYGDAYRFDMSRRAMSVFTGYDQAAIAYAVGALLAIYLVLGLRSSRGRLLAAVGVLPFLVSIVTSARVGFVTLVTGVVAMLLPRKDSARSLLAAVLLVAAFLWAVVPVGRLLLPDSATLERFEDVLRLLDVSSSSSVVERSEGVSALVETQVRSVIYPKDIDVLWGLGDNGRFVSDSGYVTTYVKYGAIGIAIVLLFFVVSALRANEVAAAVASRLTVAVVPISAAVPGLVALFCVGAIKGGHYFLTYKIGELFAVVLALSVVEGELAFTADPDAAETMARWHFGLTS